MNSIFQKEWLKIKLVWWLALLVVFVHLGLIFVGIQNTINSSSVKNFVLTSIFFKIFSFEGILDTNLIFAGLVSAFGYYKERENARLRLHFHLPYSHHKALYLMAGFGLFMIGIVYLLEFIAINAFVAPYLMSEIILVLNKILGFNFLQGLIIYFGVASIIIEPKKLRAFGNLLIMGLIVYIMLDLNEAFFTADKSLPYLILFLIFELSSYHLSFYRYKRGYIK